jgi:hypothetical protein
MPFFPPDILPQSVIKILEREFLRGEGGGWRWELGWGESFWWRERLLGVSQKWFRDRRKNTSSCLPERGFSKRIFSEASRNQAEEKIRSFLRDS